MSRFSFPERNAGLFKQLLKLKLNMVTAVVYIYPFFYPQFMYDQFTHWHSFSKFIFFFLLGQSYTTTPLRANKTGELKNCTPASIEEFPIFFFNQHQRQHGAVIINFAVVFYMSWAVAIICDDYFVPCLEIICDKMGLQTDVAGATFMAFGSSAPELFISLIGK